VCCGFRFNYYYILIYVRYFSDWKFDVLYRVRLEKGDDGKQRGGKNQNTAHILQVTTAISNNTALVEASDNHTGRAKQSSPMGESIKSLANQLLGSRYFEQDSDESETDSEEYSSESMVEEDVRTPPKLKPQLKHKQSTQHVKIPPKRTEISVHSQSYEDTEEEVNNKGVAVPVIIEDDDDVEKTIERLSYSEPIATRHTVTATTQKKKSVVTTTTTTTPKPYYEATSSDGVSTWVLLSGSSSSTTPPHLTNKAKTNKPQTPGNHKPTHITPTSEILQTTSSSATTKDAYQGLGGFFGQPTIESYYYHGGEVVGHVQSSVTPVSSTRKPVRIGGLPSPSFTQAARPQLRQNETLELLKLSKTRKPNPALVTTNKIPTTATTTTTTTTSVPTKLPPVNEENSNQKARVKVTTVSPIIGTTDRHQDIEEPQRVVATTEDETDSSEVDNMEDTSTDTPVETTTKHSRRPPGGNMKRKKNKNRRRRPSNKPEVTGDLESKTGDVNATSTNNKVAIKERPLSTRIYNYLAREVMPSVGVGLIGLVVTAGLAGLIMYPFGGGLTTRRTYEELPPHNMNPNTYYQHGQYDGGIDNSQSEEEMFGKLLEGMNDKGEFTYSGIGEETTGYAGVPGIGGDENSQYKTGGGNVDDRQTYSSAGVRYDGGRINDNIARYDAAQQGTVSYTGTGKNVAVYPYSYGSQQNYGSNVRSDNTQDIYQYGGMATRSREGGDTVRESQHLYSGNVNAAKRRYTVGSVPEEGKPLQHAGTQVTAYGGPYYTLSSVDPQPYTRNAYGTLTAVGGQTHGNVQVDSKAGSHHLGNTERALESKQKTASFAESISSGNQQYRRGTSESRQQYRNVIGTQPRSGGTVIAVSVTRQPDLQGKEEGPQTEQSGVHENIQTVSGHESVSSQPTQERHKNRSAGSQDSSKVYGGLFDASSRISPELQKRGSLSSGRVEHGPRSLRHRRDTSASTNSKVPDEDVKDNEIYSSQSKEITNTNHIINLSQGEGNEIPTHIASENVMNLSGDKQIGEGILEVKGGSKTKERESSTIKGEVTTGPIEETKDPVLGNESQTESTTLEYELPTTTELNDYDTDGEDIDIEEEVVDEYVTTNSPEIMTVSDETSTKDSDAEMTTEVPEPQFSLLGLVRRIARFKIRMGLSLLRSTSQALTKYIEGVQRRMDKNYNSYNSRSVRAKKFKRGT
jgi:hypothetical protein